MIQSFLSPLRKEPRSTLYQHIILSTWDLLLKQVSYQEDSAAV